MIKEKHGVESAYVFDGTAKKVPCISSGSYAVDKALGIGGFPYGRMVEILGPASSGKTTMCLHVIANAQKVGKKCGFIDVENALDPIYAEQLGVQLVGDNALIFSQPDNGEEALQIAETMIRTGEFGVVVIDSIAALVPRAELEGAIGDSHIGLQARLMSQACRMLSGPIKKTETLVIFTNQIRLKIGVQWGSPEVSPGGEAMKFYSSVRVDIRKTQTDKTKDEEDGPAGTNVRVKIIKNKLAPPFRIAETSIEFGTGFNKEKELIEMGLKAGAVCKGGSWYSVNGVNIGQGINGAIEAIRNNEELRKSIVDVLFPTESEDQKNLRHLRRLYKATIDEEEKKKLKVQIKELKNKIGA
jgi:recombination protein RecA